MSASASSGAGGIAGWGEPQAGRPRPQTPDGGVEDPVSGRATAESRETPRSLSFFDFATLGVIALLVVLVSLPRLRRFALRENETDAIRTLRVLAADEAASDAALASGKLASLLASSTDRRVRLEDVEVLADGRLRRHGYLFAAAPSAAGRRAIVAWPWEHGRTGLGAFAIEPGGEPLGIANQDGLFSGPAHPPPALDERIAEAWRPLAGP